MGLDRRSLLAGLASAAVLAPARGQPLALGAVAAQVGIAFGTAFDREIWQDAPYATLVARESRVLATENALKFDWLRPRGPVADFTEADRLVDFAARNGRRLRGTALIWNDWPPPWLRRVSAREVGGIMDRHIDEVVGRYRGRVHSWDVVNEPFFPPQRQPGGFRQGVWYDALGPDYVARAFRRAAAADPGAQLILNEAFCEQEDELGKSVRPPLLRLVDTLRDAGVPLHGVGLQGHLKPHLPYDDGAFVAYLHELARRDLDILITELDVDDSGLPDDVAERDRRVAARLEAFLTAVLSVPRVTTIVTWHLSDKYSWYATAPWYAQEVARRGGNPRRAVRSHLYDPQLAPKPAREAVLRALLSRAPR